MRLCKTAMIGIPVAEPPVNIRNFFSLPFIPGFKATKINTRPDKEKKIARIAINGKTARLMDMGSGNMI